MEEFPENKTEIEVVDKRIVKRITISNFASNVLEAFNISRGGVYTVKRLLINPGQLAKDFVGVSRHRITPPINVLIISTAIVLILANRIDAFSNILDGSLNTNPNSPTQENVNNEVIQVFASYFNLLLWLYIPIAAIFSLILNRKRGFNYAENLVFQTYNLCLTNFVFIATFPLVYYSLVWFSNVYMAIALIYMIYAYKEFFRKKWIRSILETVTLFITSSIVWGIALAIALILISYYVSP